MRHLVLALLLSWPCFVHAVDINAFWCEGKSCDYTHQIANTVVGKDSINITFKMDGKIIGISFFGIYGKIRQTVNAPGYRAYVMTNGEGGHSLFMAYPEHYLYIFHWNPEMPVDSSVVAMILDNGIYIMFSDCDSSYMHYELGQIESKCPSSKK